MSCPQAGRPEASRMLPTVGELGHKRRGERGVNYDEYGAEMDPNARVWKVYVDETDKADKELVEGWNSAMDVMLGSYMFYFLWDLGVYERLGVLLVFAAVFSAILTAFVIESSKDLRPDYSEISARALSTISKTLLSPGAVPSDNGLGASQAELPEFVPTRAAVVVNTLWFLSLALSIAVTLITIMAKEWCYFFMTRRTGAKLTQGRLRQKRWDGIKHWKMEEIISTIPLLMHISLLLFAIGLSIYLWNINPKVAIPMVITILLALLYYIVTVFLPLFFKYCPYTTVIVKLAHPLWTALFKSAYSRALFQILIMTPAWALLLILDFKNSISGKLRDGDNNPENDPETATVDTTHTIHGWVNRFEKSFYHRVEEIHKDFLVDSSGSGENETPMDKATSAMLLWMITHCEEPKSVDLALKALAGADLWLPSELFLCNEIDTRVLRKLERCLYVLESPNLRSHGSTWEELLDSAYLYSRALATLIRTRSIPATGLGAVSWDEWESCMKRIHKIANSYLSSNDRSQAFDSASCGFGALLLEGSSAMYKSSFDDFQTKQCKDQWQLIVQISTNQVTGFPPSPASVRALVNVITRTLLYAPESPLPLVNLFNAYDITPGNEDATLGHAIGIALTVARFTSPRYAPVPVAPDSPLASQYQAESVESGPSLSRLEHGRVIYNKLSTKQPTQRRTRALLTFGLLGLLDLPSDNLYHSPDEIRSIRQALQTFETAPVDSRDPTILTHEDRYLRYLGYHKLMPQTHTTFDLETQFKAIVESWLDFWVGSDSPPTTNSNLSEEVVAMHLGALLSPSRCRLFGSKVVDKLVAITLHPESSGGRKVLFPKDGLSLVAKKLCLRSLADSVTDWPGCSKPQETELHTIIGKLIKREFYSALIDDLTKGGELVPYVMRFLWIFTSTLINNSRPRGNSASPSPQYNEVMNAMYPPNHDQPSRWTCVRHTGLEAEWFERLRDQCKEHPQNILDSGILDELEKPCKDGCHGGVNHGLPTADGLISYGPARSDDAPITWPKVYGRLKTGCKTSVAENQPVKSGPQEDEAEIVETVIDREVSQANPV